MLSKDQLLRKACKNYFKGIPSDIINEFSRLLFPVLNQQNPYTALYSSLLSYYQLKLNKKDAKFQNISTQVQAKADTLGQSISLTVKSFLNEHVLQLLKQSLLSRTQQTDDTNNDTNVTNATTSNNNHNHKNNSTNKTDKHNYELNKRIQQQRQYSTNKDITIQSSHKVLLFDKQSTEVPIKQLPFNTCQPGQVSSSLFGHLSTNCNFPQSSTQNSSSTTNSQSNKPNNLCFCDKALSQTSEQSFQCIHCQNYYHYKCMKKQKNAKLCSNCHISRQIPTRPVRQTLYIGLLRKDKRKHQINFMIDQSCLGQLRIQVRCIRIKQQMQNFILFPDLLTVILNGTHLRDFQPLHRQSSLKTRKDEPFYLTRSNIILGENKMVLLQQCQDRRDKQFKDMRIQHQNHLFGIFLVEQKNIEQLGKQIRKEHVISLSQSKQLMEDSFTVNNYDSSEQISCQIIKIPLTCILSTERIDTPVRGLFCKHYQCFDLDNFLKLTGCSANPRWVCPLCRMPAYDLRVDCILHAILVQNRKAAVREVMFGFNGDFTVDTLDKQDELRTIHSIAQLAIEQHYIRPVQDEPNNPRKKIRHKFTYYDPEKLISLDD